MIAGLRSEELASSKADSVVTARNEDGSSGVGHFWLPGVNSVEETSSVPGKIFKGDQ